jgi:hypothetical protein
MSQSYTPRATAFALAAAITLSLMASLDALAVSEHAGAQLAASCAAATTFTAQSQPGRNG